MSNGKDNVMQERGNNGARKGDRLGNKVIYAVADGRLSWRSWWFVEKTEVVSV